VLSAVAGVLLEDLGTQFAAFSPLSGASHLLNETSAAVLDLVREHDAGPGVTELAVVDALSEEAGMAPGQVVSLVEPHWNTLVAAGLIRRRVV
jgi:PqqD family protein of HPr-rel-A system